MNFLCPKYFVKIVNVVSLIQAADLLHIIQPKLSQQLVTLEAEMQQQLGNTLIAIERLTENAMEADERELAEHNCYISQVLDVIRSVAKQTKPAGLERAIEAARAGDAGPGFAVLVDEVRELAQRTGDSVRATGKMICSIQHGTGQMVDAL